LGADGAALVFGTPNSSISVLIKLRAVLIRVAARASASMWQRQRGLLLLLHADD